MFLGYLIFGIFLGFAAVAASLLLGAGWLWALVAYVVTGNLGAGLLAALMSAGPPPNDRGGHGVLGS